MTEETVVRSIRISKKTWERFVDGVAKKYGRTHGFIGYEIEEALTYWASYHFSAEEMVDMGTPSPSEPKVEKNILSTSSNNKMDKLLKGFEEACSRQETVNILTLKKLVRTILGITTEDHQLKWVYKLEDAKVIEYASPGVFLNMKFEGATPTEELLHNDYI